MQGQSRIKAAEIDLSNPDYDADVLISAAAARALPRPSRPTTPGAKVMIVTKLRMGDATP